MRRALGFPARALDARWTYPRAAGTRLLDHVAIAEALEQGDDAAREAACRELGVVMQRSDVEALVKLCAETYVASVRLPFVVALMQRALESEQGFVHERVDDHVRPVHCLLVRWTDDAGNAWLTVGIKRSLGRRKAIDAAWYELEPWSKRLEQNRERLDANAYADRLLSVPTTHGLRTVGLPSWNCLDPTRQERLSARFEVVGK